MAGSPMCNATMQSKINFQNEVERLQWQQMAQNGNHGVWYESVRKHVRGGVVEEGKEINSHQTNVWREWCPCPPSMR